MQIYLDNAATTKMSKTAIETMLPYMDTVYGNPSSLHSVGQAAAEALQDYCEKDGIEYDHSQFPNCESCGHCCDHEI